MANVLVALRCFCHLWKSKAIIIHVDNKAVVMSLKYGRIKNPILQALIRSIWLIAGSDVSSLSKYNNCVWWPINGNWSVPNFLM